MDHLVRPFVSLAQRSDSRERNHRPLIICRNTYDGRRWKGEK